jgi:hypothetical protein
MMPKSMLGKIDESIKTIFDIGLVQQPILLNPIGFGLLNKSRKRLRLLLVS